MTKKHRPPVNRKNPEKEKLAVLMYQGGMRVTDIASQLGIGHGSVYKILDEHGIKYPTQGKKHKIVVTYCEECKHHGNCEIEKHEVKYCGKGIRQ
jgi:transposase